MNLSRLLGQLGGVIAARFVVGEVVGIGTSSCIVEATDLRTDRLVAVKLLDPAYPWTARAIVALESRAARIQHPTVSVAFDAGEQHGVSYFAFQRLAGQTLAERLEDGPLTVDDACRVFGQLLSALDAVHAQQLVHCGVNPANLFLMRCFGCAPTIRLLDFGSARINDEDEPVAVSIPVMSPYAAPEQSRSDARLDHRADLYGVGVSLFHALTGICPHSFDRLPDIRSIDSRIPGLVADVVARATELDPSRRYPSASAMQTSLSASAAVGSATHDEDLGDESTIVEGRRRGRTLVMTSRPVVRIIEHPSTTHATRVLPRR